MILIPFIKPDIMSINEFRNLECRALGMSSTYRNMLPLLVSFLEPFVCTASESVMPSFEKLRTSRRTAMVSIVVQSLSFCNPMDCSTPRSFVLLCLPEFAQIHVH